MRAPLRARNGDLAPLDVGGVRLDPRTRRAEFEGRSVDLTDREFALLEQLMKRPGQLFSRGQLLSRVWGVSFDPGTNIVDVYVGRLRRKVGEERIETVRNRGYRFAGDGSSGR